MSHETIERRTAAVRKSWNYGERLVRVIAANERCRHLLQQLGLAEANRKTVFAMRPVSTHQGRLSG
jgi:hypothetical protein